MATSSAPAIRKNAPMGIRRSFIAAHQKIAFRIASATPTINASGPGLLYQGSEWSRGMSVQPYTRPRNSSSGFGLLARLNRIVTVKHTDHAKIAIQKFCAIVDGNVCRSEEHTS